jgi:TonB-dependent receptor
MHSHRKNYLAASAATIALFTATGSLAQVKTFDIPAEAAVKAIPEFAAQAGIQIGAATSQLDGIQTRAVHGNLDTKVALKQLLEGTNLVVAEDNGTVISLRTARSASQAVTPSGTTASPDQGATIGDSGEQVIVVRGIRKAYADAVNEKKRELEISDGISADGLDKLPDLNLGEALQRLPGVQISRTEEGRDATLSIRGLPGEYALPTINGVIYAQPLVLSSNPFGAYPSDIFNSARIEKTPMADVQSGAIAGRVDMQIGGALEAKDVRKFKLSYEYNELGNLGAPGASLRWNHHFSPDLAVSANLAYQNQNFRRDEIMFTAYNTLSATNTQNFASQYSDYYAPTCVGTTATYCSAAATGTGSIASTGILYLAVPRQYTRINKGQTLAFSGSVEYRVSDDLKVGLNGFYSNKNMDGTHQYYAVATANGTGVTIVPQSAPVQLADGRWIVHDVKVLNPDIWMSSREYFTRSQAQGWFATADFTPGKWKINAIVSESSSDAFFLEQQYDFETLNVSTTPLGGAGNGIVGEWNDGAGSVDDFVYHLTPPAGQTSLVYAQPATGSWNWGGVSNPTVQLNGTTAADSTNQLRFTGSPSWGQQHVSTAKVHAEYPLTEQFSVAGGIEDSQVEYDSQAVRTSAYGIQAQNLNQSMVVSSPFMSDFFGGKLGSNGLSNWTISDPSYFDAIQPVSVYPGGDLSALGYNIQYGDGQYARYNFTYRTGNKAAFLQGKYSLTLFGIPVRGNIGVRYEELVSKTDALTKVSSAGGPLGAPSDFKYTTFKSKHNYTLPSAIIVADLTDKLVLRLADYKSYAAPLIRQNTPVSVVGTPSLDASGNTSVSLTYGNPNLHPYTAESQDISLEWYNRRGSVVSLAYYQKTIAGFIASIVDKSLLCPTDASQYGLGTLTWDSATATCQSSLAAPGTKYYVNASGSMNYEQPIHVRGYELNVQQNFDWLPKPFNNLGTVFNYTNTKAAGRINGAVVTLNNVSPQSVNWVTYYETKKWGIRATYSWRAAYAPSTFYQAINSIMVAARDQWDVSATYNLSDRFSIQFSGFNLTNQEVYRYTNQPELPAYHDLDGRTYTIALKGTF